jgi:adenine specific DNA methylase Mod
MEIEFYCKDARERFISENSVDLFIAHAPFHRTNAAEYVDSKNTNPMSVDKSLQLQDAHSVEEYVNSIVTIVKHMEHSLKDNGSILLISPNGPKTFKIISKVIEETNLLVNKTLIWNFEKWIGDGYQKGNGTNLIFHLTNLRNIPYKINGLKSLIIEDRFGPSREDEEKYGHIGFMADSLPEALADLLVLTFSNETDTVADVMGGTGSVAISALKNNRKAIYNDSSAEQVKLAKKRISDIIEQTTKEI